MKKKLLITVFFFFALMVGVLNMYAQSTMRTVHLILIADTNAIEIGEACAKDTQNMFSQVKRMVDADESLSIQKQSLTDGKLSASELEQKLENIQIQPNDIVFFYFSGHGFWANNQLYLQLNEATKEEIALQKIKNVLNKKQAYAKYYITDCCKKHLGKTRGGWLKWVFPVSKPFIDKNFKTLMSYSGILTVESCKAGQYSCTGSDGSIFTNAFIKAINELVEAQEDISWRAILKKAKKTTEDEARTMLREQVPIYDDSCFEKPSSKSPKPQAPPPGMNLDDFLFHDKKE